MIGDGFGRIVRENDVVKILVTFVSLYGAYVLLGVLAGLSMRGMIATLVQLTLLIALYSMVALALNLHWGYTGLFNIGIVGFMAVGAYTMLMLSKPPVDQEVGSLISGLGLPFFVGVVGGVVAAALVGFVVALPALRLRADYLAITTIAFSEIIRFVYKSSIFQSSVPAVKVFGVTLVPELPVGTGGGRGLLVNFDDPITKYVLNTGWFKGFVDAVNAALGIDGTLGPVLNTGVVAVALLVVVGAYYWLFERTGESPFGRVLKAIREDEDVARALGKNTDRFKIKSFMLGCALMGLAGVFYAIYFLGSVNPTAFKPQFTFFVWVALIIGGAGSNTGSIVGSAIFVGVLFQGPLYVKNVIENFVQFGQAPPTIFDALGGFLSLDWTPFVAYTFDNISHLRIVALGVVLVWLMKRRPSGLLGHRKETAAAIPLERPIRSNGSDVAPEGDDGQ